MNWKKWKWGRLAWGVSGGRVITDLQGVWVSLLGTRMYFLTKEASTDE